MARYYQKTGLKRGVVYGIRCGEFTKIGHTQDVAERMKVMGLYNPHPLELVYRRRTDAALHFEGKMHEVLEPHALGREWFRVTADQIRGASNAAIRHVVDVMRTARQQGHDRREKWIEERRALGDRPVDKEIWARLEAAGFK